jgi:pyruvate,water dikinase
MVREIMLTIGEQLHKDGALNEPRDVFYLTVDEIRHYTIGENYQQHVAGLKEVYEQLDQIPAYSRLIFPQDGIVEKQVLAGTTFSWADEASALFGTPSSPGVVEGEALVVTAIHADLDANDKIIVAETTDPGWVFLLTQAKAVIAERGSLLSHTAIVSRELHKPSVVGVPGATRRIKTGDRIRVDGSTGKIEVLS